MRMSVLVLIYDYMVNDMKGLVQTESDVDSLLAPKAIKYSQLNWVVFSTGKGRLIHARNLDKPYVIKYRW